MANQVLDTAHVASEPSLVLHSPHGPLGPFQTVEHNVIPWIVLLKYTNMHAPMRAPLHVCSAAQPVPKAAGVSLQRLAVWRCQVPIVHCDADNQSWGPMLWHYDDEESQRNEGDRKRSRRRSLVLPNNQARHFQLLLLWSSNQSLFICTFRNPKFFNNEKKKTEKANTRVIKMT